MACRSDHTASVNTRAVPDSELHIAYKYHSRRHACGVLGLAENFVSFFHLDTHGQLQ